MPRLLSALVDEPYDYSANDTASAAFDDPQENGFEPFLRVIIMMMIGGDVVGAAIARLHVINMRHVPFLALRAAARNFLHYGEFCCGTREAPSDVGYVVALQFARRLSFTSRILRTHCERAAFRALQRYSPICSADRDERMTRPLDQLSLYDDAGARKYLSIREVSRFLNAARNADVLTCAFCRLLAFTGCRISEALAVTGGRLDAETGRVILRTLKRRGLVFRAVPIPPELMRSACEIARSLPSNAPIWNWSRQTAWSRVKAVMKEAGIVGAHATPKGLRHAFGVANAEEGIPMATTQKWLGHAKLETTAIYQQAVGREEDAFAQRVWLRWTSP